MSITDRFAHAEDLIPVVSFLGLFKDCDPLLPSTFSGEPCSMSTLTHKCLFVPSEGYIGGSRGGFRGRARGPWLALLFPKHLFILFIYYNMFNMTCI